jgi:dihydrofolate reductase
MTKTRCNLAISLDGYLAGPNQSVEHPLGEGGTKLHEWVFELAAFHAGGGSAVNASTQIVEENLANIGAVVMGRNMFGGGPGPWRNDPPWTGWWGEDPPYHAPVFVVTHHAREPLVMQGGTTFHFVTDGVEAAYAKARAVAGDRDISIGGGASVVQQCLAAGVLDEINLSIVPVLLGAGERLFDRVDAGKIGLKQVRVIEAPGVTHLRYQRVR